MINIITSSRYKIARKGIKDFVDKILSENGLTPEYTINIIFIGRNKMKSISAKYKKEAIALPVLSFPYHNQELAGEKMVGEVFVCYPQAVLLAAERNKKVDVMIYSLIEHGISNLLK